MDIDSVRPHTTLPPPMQIFPTLAAVILGAAPLFSQVDLVARYRMDEVSGTALVDEGPNGISGTYVSGYTLGQGGVSGTAVGFSEIAIGHGDIASHPALTSMTSNTSYSAWFTTNSTVGYRRIFASQDGGIGVGLFYSNLLFTTRGVQDYVQAASIQVGPWYHAAWVFDATLLCSFYLNGQFIGSVQGAGPALAPTSVFHVASRSASTELWDGLIDDIQIYQGTLSAAEISLLFNNPGLAFNSKPTTYCTAKTNSLGCTPQIAWQGAPNAGVPGGFTVLGTNVRNQKAGLLLYGVSGRASTVFQGGVLCIAPPVKRTVPVTSGGTPLPISDCSGVYALDMNAFGHGVLGGTPLGQLTLAGQVVDAQFWGRDPGFPAPFNSTLTDGLEWTVGL